MSGWDISGPSTTNRRYGCVLKIGCHCQNFSPTFLVQIPNKDFRALPETLSFADFDALFQDSDCILYFVCQHNVNSVLNHVTHVNSTISSRLILCTADSGISRDHNVMLVDTETGEIDSSILRKIHTVFEASTLYDDAASPTMSGMAGGDTVSLCAQENSRTVTMLETDDVEHLYEPLINVSSSGEKRASGQFLEATSMKPNKSGIQILDTLCLPTDNTEEDIKFVRNIMLPKLKSEKRLSEIAKFLKNSNMVDEVIDMLTEECFQWTMVKHFSEEITGILKFLWTFLDKRKGDIVMAKKISRLSNLLIAKILLLHLNLGCESKNLVHLFEKLLIPKIRAWLKIKTIDKKVKTSLEGSKLLMKDFVKVIKRNYSALELGDWKESLRFRENQNTLLTVIGGMTLIEKVACVLGLISLNCDSTVQITDLPMLVEKACRGCFVSLKWEKETKAYTYASLTSRALVYLIKKIPAFQDETETNSYKEAMEKMLNPKAWTKDQKELLLQDMMPYVMHSCKEIRWIMLNIIGTTCDMGQIVRVVIQNGCRAGGLYIKKEEQTYGEKCQKPHWSDCKGVFGEVEVRLKILVPTKNCIAEGINDKYLERQIIGHERLSNTLSVLVHLHKKKSHKNIVKLVSYQLTQMPLFYATEAQGAINFLKYFLNLRENGESCSIKTLYRYVYDAVSAMCFLHSENFVHRDITTCRFEVLPESQSLRLSDFRLAKELQRATDTLCLDDSNTLAVRWSAVESLQKDEFSIKSDTWMFALFIYEVFTHGCWPYSEQTGKETDDTMHMVITRDYNQSQPPCIPDKMFKLMLSCWDRRIDRRPSMYDLQENIKQFLQESEESTEDILIRYPKMQEKQKKNDGQPELGLSPLIQQLKDKTAEPYYNTKARPMTALFLRHEDLIGDFEPEFVRDRNRVTVTIIERLGKFSKGCTLIHYNQLREINDLSESNLDKIVEAGEPYLKYKYKDRGGETLIDYAFRNGNCEDLTKLLYRLANRIKKFHDNNWIVRCFSAKDIWQTGKRIYLLRLGRTCILQNDTAGDGHVIDKPFEDRLHWLPLEVHRDHCYTKKSDVYMFAMVMYEIFTAMNFNRENPLRNPLLCVPFAMIPRNELQDVLLSGDLPEKPEYCPISLYKLMTECWSRDRVNRPTISDIVKRLKDILRRKDFNTDDDLQTVSSVELDYFSFSESETDSDSEDYVNDMVLPEAAPPLPNREGTIGPLTGQGNHSNESSSVDSYPSLPPVPLAQFSSPWGSRSSRSSSRAQSGRGGEIPAAEAICMNDQLVRIRRLFWRNDNFNLTSISSPTDTRPGYGVTRCISEDNNIYDEPEEDDYLTAVKSPSQWSCDSSTSSDSFPSESPTMLQEHL